MIIISITNNDSIGDTLRYIMPSVIIFVLNLSYLTNFALTSSFLKIIYFTLGYFFIFFIFKFCFDFFYLKYSFLFFGILFRIMKICHHYKYNVVNGFVDHFAEVESFFYQSPFVFSFSFFLMDYYALISGYNQIYGYICNWFIYFY